MRVKPVFSKTVGSRPFIVFVHGNRNEFFCYFSVQSCIGFSNFFGCRKGSTSLFFCSASAPMLALYLKKNKTLIICIRCHGKWYYEIGYLFVWLYVVSFSRRPFFVNNWMRIRLNVSRIMLTAAWHWTLIHMAAYRWTKNRGRWLKEGQNRYLSVRDHLKFKKI